jgi:hypothetical protein
VSVQVLVGKAAGDGRAIVSNKLLAGALQFIKDKQAEKDVEKFSKLRTKRDKRLLEKRKKRVA